MSPPDLALVMLLAAVLPGYMLAKSLAHRGPPPSGNRVRRYQRTIATVVIPSVAVAILWIMSRRSSALLGLGAPDRLGLILIAVAVVLIGVLMVTAPRAKRPTNAARNAAAEAWMPIGRRETTWFLAFAVAVGAGWELLYRGYLLWVLTPALGTIGAVLVMGLSYGVAHGYRSAGALIASIASALIFATAYALTLSLWWLIVVHVGLPLVGLRLRNKPTP